MPQSSNQIRAAFTISKYSLLATLRSPTSIVFSLLFPVIFITVFGSIVDTQAPVIKLAVAPGSDTAGMVYKAINKMPFVTLQTGMSAAQQQEALSKGRIAAVVNILADSNTTPRIPHYTVNVKTINATSGNAKLLQTMMTEAISSINLKVYPGSPSVASVNVTTVPGRIYRTIDFILPGQLVFSLLMAGVYGSSFLLFSLRQSLALKRLRTAPIQRRTIIAGEMLSRLFFQVISFIVMLMLGYFAFNFTLLNGIATFAEMLVFSLFGIGIFMGIGFIISGVVQSENSIAPIANTVVLPQILLCGLFFPIENYPHFMQVFCNALPLTLFVDGMRKIAFEGAHIWQLPATIGGLVVWTFIIGPLSVKSFRWE